jgi:hypothetical protein
MNPTIVKTLLMTGLMLPLATFAARVRFNALGEAQSQVDALLQ